MASLKHITKISLAHNNLTSIPNTGMHQNLKELRLGYNQINAIPASISSNNALETLDLGHNLISSMEELEPLKSCTSLRSLNLAGNPVCTENKYSSLVRAVCPDLLVLDGKKVAEKKAPKAKGRDDREVFISNLPYDAGERHIQRFFLDLGKRPVVKVQILKKKTNGRSKGSAFVKLRTPEMAKRACEDFNNKTIACTDRDGGISTRQVFVRPTWRDVHGKPLKQDAASLESEFGELSNEEPGAFADEVSALQNSMAPTGGVESLLSHSSNKQPARQVEDGSNDKASENVDQSTELSSDSQDEAGTTEKTPMRDEDSSLFDLSDLGKTADRAESSENSYEVIRDPSLVPQFQVIGKSNLAPFLC